MSRLLSLLLLIPGMALAQVPFPVGFFASSSPAQAAPPTPYEQYLTNTYSAGLVSYWMLASNAVDSVGTNNGVETGAPSYGQAGLSGSQVGAAQFGTGKSVRCEPRPAGYPPPLGASNWTIVAWINRAGAGTVISSGNAGYADMEPICAKGMAQAEGGLADANYILGLRSYSNAIRVCVDMEEGTNTSGTIGLNHPATGDVPVTNGVWHLVACTYDGANWALYLDDFVLANYGTNTFSVNRPAESKSQLPFCIGSAMRSDQTNVYGAFNGSICHLALWSNRILTSNEIADLYQHGGSRLVPQYEYGVPDDGSLTNGSIAVLGDRTSGFSSYNGAMVDSAIMEAMGGGNYLITNIVAVGDLADSTWPYGINDTLLGTAQGRGGNIFPATGNHDYDTTNEVQFPVYFDGVTTNNNGGKFYYSQRLGEVEFFFLDDNPENAANAGGINASSVAAFMGSTMGQWITNAIRQSTAPWKIVVQHHIAYTDSTDSPYTSLRWPWASLGVQVVLQGHAHGVERIYTDGVYFCTWAMGGGAHHGWNPKAAFTQYRLEDTGTYGYGVIIATTNLLGLEWYNTYNDRLDRTIIRKNY